MNVYVVMGNDFPAAVFATEGAAERYCDQRRAESEKTTRRPIHWRVYKFELQQ